MASVYKWKLYCTTESAYVSGWNQTQPTVCFNNNGHSINTNSITITDQITETEMKIKEESVPTGGNIRCETRKIVCSANSSTYVDVSFDYPISIYAIAYVLEDGHQGNTLDISVAPNTVIGAIISSVAINDTTIYVSPTVIENIQIGYYCYLSDGTNFDSLGYVLSKGSNFITVKTATVHAFSPYTPTYVLMTIKTVVNYDFGPAGDYKLGESIIGAKHIPAGLVTRGTYTNNTNSEKTIIFQLELKY